MFHTAIYNPFYASKLTISEGSVFSGCQSVHLSHWHDHNILGMKDFHNIWHKCLLGLKDNSPKITVNTFFCPYLQNSPASHDICLKYEEWWQFTCLRGRRSLSLWHMFCKKKKEDKNPSIQCHPGSEGETMTIIHIWSILKCDTNLWYPAVKIICPSSLKLSAFMF